MNVSRVHVLWARHDALDESDLAILSPAERDRIASFHRIEDRQRSATGVLTLRTMVSTLTGRHPADVDIQRRCPTCSGAHGRPLLPGTGLHASISHAGEWVVVAVGSDAPLGVDVEVVGRIAVDGLGRLVLGPQEHASGPEEFFVLWTRKEAVVKATGAGLTTPLTSVIVSPADRPAALVSAPGVDPGHGAMVDLDPPRGYAAALAVLTGADVPISVDTS